MGKLNISQELSDKISKSIHIKQTNIDNNGGNKPFICEHIKQCQESPVKRNQETTKKYTPVKDYPKKNQILYKLYKINHIEISKIVFISSIIGDIGITLGIKLGLILFL